MKQQRGLVSQDTSFEAISIKDIDIMFIRTITLGEIYDYLLFLSRKRNLNEASRARKVSSIRSFYRYLTTKAKLLDENIVQELDSPRLRKVFLVISHWRKAFIYCIQSMEKIRSVTTAF